MPEGIAVAPRGIKKRARCITDKRVWRFVFLKRCQWCERGVLCAESLNRCAVLAAAVFVDKLTVGSHVDAHRNYWSGSARDKTE